MARLHALLGLALGALLAAGCGGDGGGGGADDGVGFTVTVIDEAPGVSVAADGEAIAVGPAAVARIERTYATWQEAAGAPVHVVALREGAVVGALDVVAGVCARDDMCGAAEVVEEEVAYRIDPAGVLWPGPCSYYCLHADGCVSTGDGWCGPE